MTGVTSARARPAEWLVRHQSTCPQAAGGGDQPRCQRGSAERLPPGSLQGKDLLLQLEDETLKLVEPHSQALLHAQPIVSIRVWGVGRDNGR